MDLSRMSKPRRCGRFSGWARCGSMIPHRIGLWFSGLIVIRRRRKGWRLRQDTIRGGQGSFRNMWGSEEFVSSQSQLFEDISPQRAQRARRDLEACTAKSPRAQRLELKSTGQVFWRGEQAAWHAGSHGLPLLQDRGGSDSRKEGIRG